MIVKVPVELSGVEVGTAIFTLVQPHFPSLSKGDLIDIGSGMFADNIVDRIRMDVYKRNGIMYTDVIISCVSADFGGFDALEEIFEDAAEFSGRWVLSAEFLQLIADEVCPLDAERSDARKDADEVCPLDAGTACKDAERSDNYSIRITLEKEFGVDKARELIKKFTCLERE